MMSSSLEAMAAPAPPPAASPPAAAATASPAAAPEAAAPEAAAPDAAAPGAEDRPTCIICMQILETRGEPCTSMPCAHAYHSACLTQYARATGRAQEDLPCPRCKLTSRESEALSLQQLQQHQQQQQQPDARPPSSSSQVFVFFCSGQPLINLSAVNRL
jgi:hypothetical protein